MKNRILMSDTLSASLAPTIFGTFDWGNDQLYKMCRENPQHTDPSVVLGKIWLIGRAYSASIERKSGAAGQVPDFYGKKVAPMIVASEIDARLEQLRKIKRVEEADLPALFSCHKYLTDLFKKIAGTEKRSLASKYLHFHAPDAFFIYDSLANKHVRAALPRLRCPVSATGPQDKPYAEFVHRCLKLRARLESEQGRRFSPREIDRHLLGY